MRILGERGAASVTDIILMINLRKIKRRNSYQKGEEIEDIVGG